MTSSQDSPEYLHQHDNVTVITSKILELPPSCIEFLPDDTGELSGYFVVGTYHHQHQPDNQVPTPHNPRRKGSLILFKLNSKELTKKVFAVASSTGCISIFRLAKRQNIYELEYIITHQVVPEDIVVLSLIWSPLSDYQDSEQPSLLFFTTSSGSVLAITLSVEFKLFKFVNNGTPLIVHDDNAWTCSISCNNIFSGGDDSKLSRVELPENLYGSHVEAISFDRPNSHFRKQRDVQVDFKVHGAGVTAILILPTPSVSHHDSFLVTGSYDDHVRVLSITDQCTAKPSRAQKLTEFFIGGGVWRLKLIQSSFHSLSNRKEAWEYFVLASCMHAGARLLKITGSLTEPWKIEVLAEMRSHQSMCYACDFQPQQSLSTGEQIPPKDLVIISTSFYDRLLLVWEWRSSNSMLVDR